MKKLRELVPAEKGYRATYILDDDPLSLAALSVVFWGVFDQDHEVTSAVALVLDGDELKPASELSLDWASEFFRVLEPGEEVGNFRDELEARAQAEQDANDRAEAPQLVERLRFFDIDATPEEALFLRGFFGSIDTPKVPLDERGRDRRVAYTAALAARRSISR